VIAVGALQDELLGAVGVGLGDLDRVACLGAAGPAAHLVHLARPAAAAVAAVVAGAVRRRPVAPGVLGHLAAVLLGLADEDRREEGQRRDHVLRDASAGSVRNVVGGEGETGNSRRR